MEIAHVMPKLPVFYPGYGKKAKNCYKLRPKGAINPMTQQS